ncbi:hypothetical protein UAJ10_10410 [Nitrospirillum sp. BR 11164]|uniref:hypothetical protein n=1 Tax=Nitrospirillum sp. BR 11164 TaxID=3104324 RepID=UPI002AFF3E09|nr:hypothetical protein [Nitrospirillum sp. BR 11164]MEA1649430.1 hypothetical protein [Nitrospirillum sp. BR 11164]
MPLSRAGDRLNSPPWVAWRPGLNAGEGTVPDSFISGGGSAGLSMADWMDAEIPEGRLLIGPTRGIPAGMRRYALGGAASGPIWRDARVIRYLHGLDAIGRLRLRLRHVVQGVDFRVSDTQLIDQAMRDLAMGNLSAFLIPRAVAPLSPPPVDPPRHDQGDEDPPGQPAQWSVTDRVVATLRRCVPLLPRDMQQAAKSLFTRETLYWLAGFLVVWAGGHLAGYGEAIDVILLGVGYAMVGWSVFQGLNDLGHGIALATTAKTQHNLDEAARRTAAGLTILTINALIALIAKVKPASGGKRPVVEEPPPPPQDPPLPPKRVAEAPQPSPIQRDLPPPPKKALGPLTPEYLPGYSEADILAIPKGERPSPSTYLTQEYQEAHAALFKDGAVRIQPSAPTGIIGKTETWVLPPSVANEAIAKSGGDVGKLEQLLGLDSGYLGSSPVRVDIPASPGYRIPTGNEFAANNFWRPGGLTWPGGLPEAVIDPVTPGNYIVKPLF